MPPPAVLRKRDYGITFLKPAKVGKNKEKCDLYSKAKATCEYFGLGGKADDFRHDAKHPPPVFPILPCSVGINNFSVCALLL